MKLSTKIFLAALAGSVAFPAVAQRMPVGGSSTNKKAPDGAQPQENANTATTTTTTAATSTTRPRPTADVRTSIPTVPGVLKRSAGPRWASTKSGPGMDISCDSGDASDIICLATISTAASSPNRSTKCVPPW